MTGGFAYTILRSDQRIGKAYSFADSGLKKTTLGEIFSGSFRVVRCADVHELVEQFLALDPFEVVMASLPVSGVESGRIVTQKEQPSNPGAFTRTKGEFRFASRPGLLTLDYDPPKGGKALSRDELFELVCSVWPEVRNGGVVWWSSASSHIWNAETNEELQGLRGQRIWVLIQDASDVPRAIEVLAQRLWLAGAGYVEVGSAGQLLVRCVIDTSFKQQARVDYVSGAQCSAPLEARRGPPLILASGGPIDSKTTLRDPSAEDRGRYEARVQQAKDALRSEAALVRAEYRSTRLAEGVPDLMRTESISATIAEARIGEAIDAAYGGTLLADFIVTVVHDDGRHEPVRVAQLLSQRDRYDGMKTLDPLNPSHRSYSADAILYLQSASPVLFSLDDGGAVYRLRHQRERIAVAKGNRGGLVERVSRFLAAQDDVFVNSGGLVRLVDGHLYPLDSKQVQNLVSQRAVLVTSGAGGRDVVTDLQREPAELVLAHMRVSVKELGVKYLTQIHSLPCVTPNGRLLSQCGWDEETGLYLHLPYDYSPQIPKSPTRDEMRQALVDVVSAVRAYNLETPDDVGAIISAWFTVVNRPLLRVAPMYVADASTAGTGKTQLCIALCSAMTGEVVGITPFSGFDEDELRKRLMTGVLTGRTGHILDNMVGYVDSAVLAGVLTSGRLVDRKLGVSGEIDGECRALITGSSNNVSLSADLLRRTVRIRLDSGSRPTERLFSFNVIDVALRDRMKIAEAVCTLLMGYFSAGAPRIAQDNAGGFVDWVKLCRQPILWLSREGLTDLLPWPVVGDPAASMMVRAEQLDPETQAHADMLRALRALSDGQSFTAREMHGWWRAGEFSEPDSAQALLREAVSEILPGRKDVSSTALGRTLANRRDRFVGDLCLRRRGESSANSAVYMVVLQAGA